MVLPMKKKILLQTPSFDEERLLWQQGYRFVAGVDEVGRGAFAGPVVAAAVILPPDFNATDEINDSKLLTPKKREELSAIIMKHALSYAIGEVGLETINAVGIGKATQQAFVKAITGLSVASDFILIDAFYISDLDKGKQKPIIKGDQKSISIAAASIIAKVYRDNLMRSLSAEYQNYNFAVNKGYGTLKHREAIRTYGLCDLHRSSFSLQKFTSST